MKESTMVLWVFFFWGGGVPAVTGIWYQLFMSDSLTNNQRSPASLLSTQHLSDSLLAGKKKKKKPKKHFRLITLANQTLPLHAHILLLSHNFFSLSHEYYLREERERAPPRFCQQ